MQCLTVNLDGTVNVAPYDPNTCTGYVILEPGEESASFLPPLAINDAEAIAQAFLFALASIVAVKVAFKLSR